MKTKVKQQIRKAMGVSALLLMVALILFSSCNFRKSFQAHYNIPLNKSLNVIKATVNTQNICQTRVEIDLLKHSAKEYKASLDLQLFRVADVCSLPETVNSTFVLLSSEGISHRAVPLYILYSNIKIFS